MKTKLTLSIRKDIIRKAKQKARQKGISLSDLFEQKIAPQSKQPDVKKLAAIRLLIRLKSKPSRKVKTLNDKELRRNRLIQKHA